MNNTATRLITLILLLQNQPNQKASALADRLGVSLRTVHRYFGMLDEMGIPVYAERGPYGGFSLVRGYKIPPLIFSLNWKPSPRGSGRTSITTSPNWPCPPDCFLCRPRWVTLLRIDSL